MKKASKETTSKSNQTRGSPQGKASRELTPKNKNTIKGVSISEQNVEDTGLLVHGRETSAVGGSKNNQRKQSYDTSIASALVARDGNFGRDDFGKSGHQRKTLSWLARNRFVSQASVLRFKETFLRDRTGLSSTDVNGKKAPSDILKKFKDTIFTDAEETLSKSKASRELDFIDYINENGDGEITAKNKPLTNREILAGALESAVKSEKELEKLQEYRYHKKGLTPWCQSLNFMRIFLPCL